MTLRDALERGVEDIAGCVPSLANVAALLVALCIEKGPSRSSGVRVTTFSSAGRPPPLVRAEEVSAPLEGSIRTTRRAPMRAEVEARPADFRRGAERSGSAQSAPRPLQQFGASSRQEAVSIDIRRSYVHAERSVQLSSTIAKQCAYLMMKTPQPTVPFSKKWIRPLPDHSDDGMERKVRNESFAGHSHS